MRPTGRASRCRLCWTIRTLSGWAITSGKEPGRDPLRCALSVDLFPDTVGHWLHLSVARGRRLPTWADLCRARDELGFAARDFVQLVPPSTNWLNMHEYALHLFSRLDAPTVPRELWDQEGCDGATYGKRAPFKG